MKIYITASLVTAPSLFAILPLLPTAAIGQSTKSGAQAIARTPDGKVDFSGVYAGPGFSHTGKGETDDAAVAIFDIKKMAPFVPGGEALFYQKNNGDLFHDDATSLCLPDGFPREAMSPYATQIAQGPGFVVIIYEYEHFPRYIPTDGRPHPPDVDLTWMGDAVGKWEGDTLVVDTIGLKAWQIDAFHGLDPRFKTDPHWTQPGYRRHSDALHVIERFRKTDPTTVAYQMTIDDPKIFTKPWSQDYIMKLHPTWRILEQVCEENNRCEAGKCKAADVQSKSK